MLQRGSLYYFTGKGFENSKDSVNLKECCLNCLVVEFIGLVDLMAGIGGSSVHWRASMDTGHG